MSVFVQPLRKTRSLLLSCNFTGDYVCAYYAFQANKEAGEGLMQYKGEKESKKRYHLFSECVDTVKKMNMKFSTGKASYSGGQ